MSNFKGQNAPNVISAGAPPHSPLGSLRVSPNHVAAFKRTYFFNGRGGGWKERAQEGRGSRKEREEKEGRTGLPFNFLPDNFITISVLRGRIMQRILAQM